MGADSQSMVPALRAWLDGADGERNADRLAEYIIEKAMGGHFGFFKLLLDMVDGPIARESDDSRIVSHDCTLIIIDDRRGQKSSKLPERAHGTASARRRARPARRSDQSCPPASQRRRMAMSGYSIAVRNVVR